MEERFFFDGIDILADQFAVNQAVEDPGPVLPYLADSPLPFLYMTVVRTEKAFNTFFSLLMTR